MSFHECLQSLFSVESVLTTPPWSLISTAPAPPQGLALPPCTYLTFWTLGWNRLDSSSGLFFFPSPICPTLSDPVTGVRAENEENNNNRWKNASRKGKEKGLCGVDGLIKIFKWILKNWYDVCTSKYCDCKKYSWNLVVTMWWSSSIWFHWGKSSQHIREKIYSSLLIGSTKQFVLLIQC